LAFPPFFLVPVPFSLPPFFSSISQMFLSCYGSDFDITERGIAMKNLYVGNLPHSTTEAELRNIFETHGAVEKITLVTDRDTGRSCGFGFVEMTNASEAEKAMAALNGSDVGGRTLTINEAKPKSDRPRGGGHRFGGGGGRGRDDYRGHPRQPREPRW